MPVLSSFSTIWFSTVVGITAPTSVVLLTASARYSAGISAPRQTYCINAFLYAMLPYLSPVSSVCSAGLKLRSTVAGAASPPSPSTGSPFAIFSSNALRFSAAACNAALSSCNAVTSVSSAVISASVSSAALVVSSPLIWANLASISFNLFISCNLLFCFL